LILFDAGSGSVPQAARAPQHESQYAQETRLDADSRISLPLRAGGDAAAVHQCDWLAVPRTRRAIDMSRRAISGDQFLSFFRGGQRGGYIRRIWLRHA